MALQVKERPSREVPAQHRLMSSADALVSVVVDRRFYFSSTALDGAQLFVLRSRMNAALNFKVCKQQLCSFTSMMYSFSNFNDLSVVHAKSFRNFHSPVFEHERLEKVEMV